MKKFEVKEAWELGEKIVIGGRENGKKSEKCETGGKAKDDEGGEMEAGLTTGLVT